MNRHCHPFYSKHQYVPYSHLYSFIRRSLQPYPCIRGRRIDLCILFYHGPSASTRNLTNAASDLL